MAMPDNDDFYARLPVVATFTGIMDPCHYRPLPANWMIGLTDVEGSTGAIENGRYKAVNAAGASVIAAVSNALNGRQFPFSFGGDGACVVVSASDEEATREALAATVAWVRDDLDLTLRAALIPVAAVREHGLDVRVMRYGASSNVSYAMFSGGGLAWADRCMKDGQFAVAAAAPRTRPDLSGLSCRWNDMPAVNGTILSLVIAPVDQRDPAFSAYVEELLGELEASPQVAQPMPERAPGGVSWPPPGLDLEARASRQRGEGLISSRLRVAWTTLVAFLVLRFGIRAGAFDPARYRRELIENSDFRKYDDALRMTLDCTPALADAIEHRLARAASANVIRFGLHRQSAALMTCIVPSSSESNHLHFVDGAAGGYALAARQLKRSAAGRTH